MEKGSKNKKKTVVVTGFGPFGGHIINNSWECAKVLKDMQIDKDLDICLIIQELPVIYESVQTIIPQIWRITRPDVVIHLGVHNENYLQIECCAKKEGYVREDVIRRKPSGGRCPSGSPSLIQNSVDIRKIIEHMNNKMDSDIKISCSAGNFLCEYVYYLSLQETTTKCLFVHVPPYNKNQLNNIAIQIKEIIAFMLADLQKSVGAEGENTSTNEKRLILT